MENDDHNWIKSLFLEESDTGMESEYRERLEHLLWEEFEKGNFREDAKFAVIERWKKEIGQEAYEDISNELGSKNSLHGKSHSGDPISDLLDELLDVPSFYDDLFHYDDDSDIDPKPNERTNSYNHPASIDPVDEIDECKLLGRLRNSHIRSTADLINSAQKSFPDFHNILQTGQKTEESLDTSSQLSYGMMQRTKTFLTLSEYSSDPHFITDRNQKYVYVNSAMVKMLGLKKRDILGKYPRSLEIFEEDAQLVDGMKKALKGATMKLKRSRKMVGEHRNFLDVLMPWKDDQSNITGVCGSHIDLGYQDEIGDIQDSGDDGSLSEAMQETLEQARIVAVTNSSVLLLGESGSGKDYLAKYIHDQSDRSDGPFKSINCAALPSELVESELFGHEKGGFTGAAFKKRGHVELADSGTLLLNEIGELPLPLQAKLLTFLDNRTFTRVGGEKEVKTDIRLIVATNRDLYKEVKSGNFREDLFYRINVFTIKVPPLRHRKDDLPKLVQVLVQEISERLGIEKDFQISPAFQTKLSSYEWPGNVRQLRNVLEKAMVIALAKGRPLAANLLDLSNTDSSDSLKHIKREEHNSQGDPPEHAEAKKDQGGRIVKPTNEELIEMFDLYIVKKGWTRARLARELSVDSSTIKKWFKLAGLPSGQKGRPRKNS